MPFGFESDYAAQTADTSDAAIAVQLFTSNAGLSLEETRLELLGRPLDLRVGPDLLGRVFDGLGRPFRVYPEILSSDKRDVNGSPINPWARFYPWDFIQTRASIALGRSRGILCNRILRHGHQERRARGRVLNQTPQGEDRKGRQADNGGGGSTTSIFTIYSLRKAARSRISQSGGSMRVALVYVRAKDHEALADVAKTMARTLEAAGHFVDLAEARADESPRLTGYDYIVLGTESATAFGKIPERVPQFLAQAGMIAGKRSMAFLYKSGLRPQKALARLMKAMEAEGMVISCAEVVANEADAADAAREAPVARY